MSTDNYLVLRVTGTTGPAYDPLRPQTYRKGISGEEGGALEYEVESQALDANDYRDASSDPQVAGLARPMPLRLIEPVPAAESSETAADSVYGATWGVYATGALQSSWVGQGVTVAVLDTGIDPDHEAFQGVTLVQKDFTGEGNGDEHGHGTHVAGTIFGQTVGDTRYSVAPGVRRALIGKVLGERSSATTAELVAAIQWAVDEGASVINMSLGFDFPGLVQWWAGRGMEVDLATSRALAQYRDNVRFFDSLVGLLRARGAMEPSALLIAASGNESKRQVRDDYAIEAGPPAAAEGIVAVAALRSQGPPHDALAVAPFSNTRAAVAAPGMDVYSARAGGGYTTMNGTSMASPHAAGVAALWAARQLDRSGSVTISGLRSRLRGTARMEKIPGADYMDVGDGLVAAPLD